MKRTRKPPSKAKQIRLNESQVKFLDSKLNEFEHILESKKKTINLQLKQIENLLQSTERVRQMIDKSCDIDFKDLRNGRYAIQLEFNAEFMGRFDRREEMEFIARQVSENIYHEIASSKFVKTARNNRRMELDRPFQDWAPIRPERKG